MSTVHTDSSSTQRYLWATVHWTPRQRDVTLCIVCREEFLAEEVWCPCSTAESFPPASPPYPRAEDEEHLFGHLAPSLLPCSTAHIKAPVFVSGAISIRAPKCQPLCQQQDITKDFSDLLLSDYKPIVAFPTGAYWVAPPPFLPSHMSRGWRG